MSRPVDKSNKPVIRTADAHRRAACALVAATAIVVSLAWFFFLVEYHDAAQIRIQEAAQNVAAAVAAVAQRCPSPTEPGSSVIASVDEAGKLSCGIVEQPPLEPPIKKSQGDRHGKQRKGISKRTRFEVFKRDGFICQYCGAHPPGTLLHADHITAVANDGDNNMDNLVTACESCNLGKGAVRLDVVPQSLSEKAAQVQEREEQLRGYQEILEAKRDRIEGELWRVAELIEPGSATSGMDRGWTSSIRRFNDVLGVHVALEAADIARGKFPYGGRRAFLYFCGICWSKIKELENG